MRNGHRDVRVDMHTVDAATAAVLLKRYGRMLGAMVKLYPGLERDEVLEIGRIAVIEAYLTHDAERSTERTWVRKVVGWRLGDAAARDWHTRGEGAIDPNIEPSQVINGGNPEHQFLRTTAVRAIARLEPRHQIIVSGRMRGETYAEISATIGIATSLCHREGQRAYELLRSILEGTADA